MDNNQKMDVSIAPINSMERVLFGQVQQIKIVNNTSHWVTFELNAEDGKLTLTLQNRGQ